MTYKDICVAYTETIHNSFSDRFYKKVTDRINSDEKSTIIVLFMQVRCDGTISFDGLYYSV